MNNTQFKISIPEPCHENWNKMTPTEKGKFCSVCQKNVYDFRKSTDLEIIRTFNENENLCGRFKNSQLNRNLLIKQKRKSFLAVGIASVITFFGFGNHSVKSQAILAISQKSSSEAINGQFTINLPKEVFIKMEFSQERTVIKREFSKNFFILEISYKNPSKDNEVAKYSGFLYDEDDLPLTDIYITNKRTHARTRTDKKGQFSMSVKDKDILYCSHKKLTEGAELDENIIEPIIINLQ